MTKSLNIFYHFPSIYRFTNLYQLEKKHWLDGVFKIADEILEEKQKLRNDVTTVKENSCDSDGYEKKQKNFIKTLLSPKNSFGDQELKDEINTLIAAVN